jgi:hypothetical protein
MLSAAVARMDPVPNLSQLAKRFKSNSINSRTLARWMGGDIPSIPKEAELPKIARVFQIEPTELKACWQRSVAAREREKLALRMVRPNRRSSQASPFDEEVAGQRSVVGPRTGSVSNFRV